MKEITILSGKGGTGKTSITAAIASVASNAVFCDNDVDAADLHLLFKPQIVEKNTFFSGWSVNIDNEKCNNCQICVGYCRFDAIHYEQEILKINSFQCEGCRLCERICPSKAIFSTQNGNNHWYVSSSRFGTLVHAQMGPGEENSGKLVTQVRKKAKEIALGTNADYVINDGPPGIGCAAISSITGTNLVLLVIEPSKSGLHDAKRLIELTKSFNIQVFAVINKYDISKEISALIEHYFVEQNIEVLAKIPFDKKMVEAMIEGKTIVEYEPDSEISKKIKTIWKKIESINQN